MVGTKHCCWGECKSDSRYPDKLPKQLQEMISDGRKAFIGLQSQVKVLKNVRDGFKLVQERTLPSKTLIEVLIYVHFIGLEEKGQRRNFQIH